MPARMCARQIENVQIFKLGMLDSAWKELHSKLISTKFKYPLNLW